MILVRAATLSVLLLIADVTARTYSFDLKADTGLIKYNASRTYGQVHTNQSGLASVFSPRMDFEQWKPLTGRGDPLRNDPTYDYEPPVLDRVHYWADETRLEKEHYPERKSEVLMLGVSSRKPSVNSRQPPWPPFPLKRYVPRPILYKYEDFAYNLSDDFPMTILVPPPPPPPGSKPPLFLLSDGQPVALNKIPQQKLTSPGSSSKMKDSTETPVHSSSFYALQESNLIYQSSTTNWLTNETKSIVNNAVSSDYAGWGPTTPVDDSDIANETHNLISSDHIEYSKHPYLFYKPMLSESPPTLPPKKISSPVVFTFYPTPLPTTSLPETSTEFTQVTGPTERTTEILEVPTEIAREVTTENEKRIQDTTTPIPSNKLGTSVDMFKAMITMPMDGGPERPEDNLYAHASENVQVFEEQSTEDIQMKTMQTMQPPPPVRGLKDSMDPIQKQQFHVNSQGSNKNTHIYTHGPYLHGRFTTPIATTIDDYTEEFNSTTEAPAIPSYLIIQGHSKVKTYSSKLKVPESEDTVTNEISKALKKNEVKHLHPIMKQSIKKVNTTGIIRKSKGKNFKSLVEEGWGSIEMQEADIGIKYDISDGTDVPIEIYRKGIVDNDVNIYPSNKKLSNKIRAKRHLIQNYGDSISHTAAYNLNRKQVSDDDPTMNKPTINKRPRIYKKIESNVAHGETVYQHNTKSKKIYLNSFVKHNFLNDLIWPMKIREEIITPASKTTRKYAIKRIKYHLNGRDEILPKNIYGKHNNVQNAETPPRSTKIITTLKMKRNKHPRPHVFATVGKNKHKWSRKKNNGMRTFPEGRNETRIHLKKYDTSFAYSFGDLDYDFDIEEQENLATEKSFKCD